MINEINKKSVIFLLLIAGAAIIMYSSLNKKPPKPVKAISTDYMGKTLPITFKVSKITKTNNVVFIEMKNSNITSIMFQNPPKHLSAGKYVEVTGTYTLYHGKPEIIIRNIQTISATPIL